MAAPDEPVALRGRHRHPGAVLVAASAFWAGGGLIGRGAPMSGTQIAFWRSLLGAAAYHLALVVGGRRLRWQDLRTATVGGLGFGLSVACLFVAYKSTTLVSANVIGCLQPLALGMVDHRRGRRLGRLLWGATAAAVAGTVLVVVGSSAQAGTWSLAGDLWALAGTGANVVYVLGTERARRTMGPLHYQASMLWVAAGVTLPIVWFTTGGMPLPDSSGWWWWVAALVAVGGTGHLLFSAAQRHVSVAASSSILLLEVVLVAVGAAVFYDEPISALQVVGMAVVAAAVGVWLARSSEVPALAEVVLAADPLPGQG